MSFGWDSKIRWSLPSGVYARGSKRSHQSALECVTIVDSTSHSKPPEVRLGGWKSCPRRNILDLHYTTFSPVFCLHLHLIHDVGTYVIIPSMCHSSTPFTSPYNCINLSVICFATGATFTYHHTLLVTPHVHLLSILFSFISSILLGFSLLPMSLHHMSILAWPLCSVLSPSSASLAPFYHTALHCPTSYFRTLHSSYVLSKYPHFCPRPPLSSIPIASNEARRMMSLDTRQYLQSILLNKKFLVKSCTLLI